MVSGAIVDLDGTVYHGDRLLPGANEAVGALRERGASLLFFSNNPTRDGTASVDHLRDLGLDVRRGEAHSAADVTARFLRKEHPDDGVYLVGSDRLEAMLGERGVEVVGRPERADVLLASWSADFGYGDMVAALRADDAGATFYGTDPDRTFPGEDGQPMPGSGAVVNAVSGVLGRDPDRILGKPSRHAAEAALDRLGADPADSVVVGDRLSTDVALGERVGMETVLVLSGVTDRADLAESDVQPDHVVDSLADVPDALGLR